MDFVLDVNPFGTGVQRPKIVPCGLIKPSGGERSSTLGVSAARAVHRFAM